MLFSEGKKLGERRGNFELCKKRADQCCFNATFPLEQRQYKNDSIQSKLIPILKLPRFFSGDEKARQFQSWN